MDPHIDRTHIKCEIYIITLIIEKKEIICIINVHVSNYVVISLRDDQINLETNKVLPLSLKFICL